MYRFYPLKFLLNREPPLWYTVFHDDELHIGEVAVCIVDMQYLEDNTYNSNLHYHLTEVLVEN